MLGPARQVAGAVRDNDGELERAERAGTERRWMDWTTEWTWTFQLPDCRDWK
jgi:hypothetical protein